jgi:hypothetical protein
LSDEVVDATQSSSLISWLQYSTVEGNSLEDGVLTVADKMPKMREKGLMIIFSESFHSHSEAAIY